MKRHPFRLLGTLGLNFLGFALITATAILDQMLIDAVTEGKDNDITFYLPLSLVGTLVAFLQNKEIKLDDLGRPLMFYGQSVHDLCERRAHFDAGEFATSFDSEEARKGWCLYDLGCKGPSTYNNCPKALFNETNWPVRAGHPCIGCSEPNFWDDLSPFYQN